MSIVCSIRHFQNISDNKTTIEQVTSNKFPTALGVSVSEGQYSVLSISLFFPQRVKIE